MFLRYLPLLQSDKQVLARAFLLSILSTFSENKVKTANRNLFPMAEAALLSPSSKLNAEAMQNFSTFKKPTLPCIGLLVFRVP
ncbi:hypothetical protein EFB08_08825 [Rufibacter latericius]|uniref:Uncharacterized protein n=1 Tax=Rufibacter latericius TaxID=2487040 RepID=A0A3M9MU47_9BACT|nr:hypothetical protein EFB08_08825 [Rufibacter latericius]